MYRGVLKSKQTGEKLDDVIVLRNKTRTTRFVYGSELKKSMPFDLQGNQLKLNDTVLHTTDQQLFENNEVSLQMNQPLSTLIVSTAPAPAPAPATPATPATRATPAAPAAPATRAAPAAPAAPEPPPPPPLPLRKLSEGWCVWQTAPSFAPIFERQDMHHFLVKRLKTWEFLNPKPKCMRVTDGKCRQMVLDLKAPFLCASYDKLIPAGFRTDMWRLCALYTHGGMYSDLHVLCTDLPLLSTLLERYDYLFCVDVASKQFRICNSWMFVKRSKRDLVWSAINKIKENVCRKMWYTDPSEFTGSTMLTKVLTARLNMQHNPSPSVDVEFEGERYGFLSYAPRDSSSYAPRDSSSYAPRDSSSHEISFRNSTLMVCGYPNYRNDLRSLRCGEHFSKLHNFYF